MRNYYKYIFSPHCGECPRHTIFSCSRVVSSLCHLHFLRTRACLKKKKRKKQYWWHLARYACDKTVSSVFTYSGGCKVRHFFQAHNIIHSFIISHRCGCFNRFVYFIDFVLFSCLYSIPTWVSYLLDVWLSSEETSGASINPRYCL